jgi:hypothetical protein
MRAETCLLWTVVGPRGPVNRCAARNAELKIPKVVASVAIAARRSGIAVLGVAPTIRPGSDSAVIAAQR